MLQCRNLEMRCNVVSMHAEVNQIVLKFSNSDDCLPGTCFSGSCMGFPSEYSMDGKCGVQGNNKLCGGKWGECCNLQGQCGTGDSFCAQNKCQGGNCVITSFPNPWPTPTPTASPVTSPSIPTPTPGSISPDGSCGGANKFTCKGSTFGDCCSSSGFCGATTGHCAYNRFLLHDDTY